MQEFQINGPYIELIGLLKALGIAETGGHAKAIVAVSYTHLTLPTILRV